MNGQTIFGREPAAIVALIEGALTLAVTLGLSVSSNQIGLIAAVVTAAFGVYLAWATKETLLGVTTGLIKAMAAVAVGFGAHLAPEQTGALIAFVTVAFGLYQRTQTSPAVAADSLQ